MAKASQVLVLTSPADYHAFVVAEGLRRKGVAVTLWHTTDFPSRQTGSAWLGDEHGRWELRSPEFLLGPQTPTTICVRQPGTPVLPPGVDQSDQHFALRECQYFLSGFMRSIGRDSFWVNPLASITRSNLKLEQLRAASGSGLRIPRSLLSNHPEHIRDFIRSATAGVIYKSFYPVTWHLTDGVAILFSSPLELENLPDDAILSATPGIFQEQVPKAFELRVTAIGKQLFAAKLDSQGVATARIDWRAADVPVSIEPFKLPPRVVSACLRIMAALDIVFGCFDLIVTPEGEYVFLEVNEAGAFLWLERRSPELNLLDAFCELLAQGTPNFHWPNERAQVKLADVHDEAVRLITEEAPKAHVPRPLETLADDPVR